MGKSSLIKCVIQRVNEINKKKLKLYRDSQSQFYLSS